MTLSRFTVGDYVELINCTEPFLGKIVKVLSNLEYRDVTVNDAIEHLPVHLIDIFDLHGNYMVAPIAMLKVASIYPIDSDCKTVSSWDESVWVPEALKK